MELVEDTDKLEECYSESDISNEKLRETNPEYLDGVKKLNLSEVEPAFSDIHDEVVDMSDEVADVVDLLEISGSDSEPRSNAELLTIYPAPPVLGGIPVYIEDLKCLKRGEYLNDVIIDFYMKYVLLDVMSPADRQRTHIFSSQFYTRLARSYAIGDYDTAGVQSWTKNVNIFQHDFIVFPVNENFHWFLVIICFANLVGTVSSNRNEWLRNGNEAQRPCLLIFDSLGSKNKADLADMLRSYLAIEYRIKTGEEKEFSEYTLKTEFVKAPRQTNLSDCGLYVLQYLESFFTDPIEDFALPIQDLSNWFESSAITRKRREIAELIDRLATHYRSQLGTSRTIDLPEIDTGEIDDDRSTGNASAIGKASKRSSKSLPDSPALFYKLNTTLDCIRDCEVANSDSESSDLDSDNRHREDERPDRKRTRKKRQEPPIGDYQKLENSGLSTPQRVYAYTKESETRTPSFAGWKRLHESADIKTN